VQIGRQMRTVSVLERLVVQIDSGIKRTICQLRYEDQAEVLG